MTLLRAATAADAPALTAIYNEGIAGREATFETTPRDPAAPLAVICASGQRAATAASLAQLHGAEDVWHVVDGGVGTWGRAGFELERPA